MNDLNVNAPIFNQPFTAINLDGKPVTAYYIGRVGDQLRTWAMSVKPTGAGRWMCIDHKRLFKVGASCPECAGTATAQEPLLRDVTPPTLDGKAVERQL